MDVRNKMIGILSRAASDAYSIDTLEDSEQFADFLIANGVTVLPEGAIILTKEEIAKLNEYQKKHFSGGEPSEN